MVCFHPIEAYQCSDGKIYFSDYKSSGGLGHVRQLSCGKCIGCRLEQSRQWAVRCVHEASLYQYNCMITLTYSDEHLPEEGTLVYKHFQDFMKRLRNLHKRKSWGKSDHFLPIRYYMSGEYGDRLGRPHFHVCLFNFDFSDRKYWRKSPAGSNLWRSETLEQLWSFGFSSIGELNFDSAAYAARYIMKKVTGDQAKAHYGTKVPEFCHMSLKPGIGAGWYEKWKADVYPHDYIVVNARKMKPPRYYDKLYQREEPFEFDYLKNNRHWQAVEYQEDNTPERLQIKETVAQAKLKQLKRVL